MVTAWTTTSRSTEPIQPGSPVIGEVLAVGEDHDRLSLGVLLLPDGLDGGVQAGTEVGPSRLHRARLESMQRVDHGAEVLRQRAAKHPATGEGHDGRTVGRLARQGVDQLLGRLDRHAQPVRAPRPRPPCSG